MSSFNETNTSTTGLKYSAFSWGDYDNDNDLDFVIYR